MYTRTLARTAGIALAAAALGIPISAAMAGPRSLNVSAKLTITGGAPPACQAGVCTLNNHGTGHMTPLGKVSFTTRITSDGKAPPCGAGSSWVRVIRTIHTAKGTIVLNEAGLQCPQPGGPRVDLVWALDGAQSTGIFVRAHGRGYDTAHPAQKTDAYHGTITLAQ